MIEVNSVATTRMANLKVSKQTKVENVESDNKPYWKIIGALMYLAMTTGTDSVFIAVSLLEQFNNYIDKQYWVVRRIEFFLISSVHIILFQTK